MRMYHLPVLFHEGPSVLIPEDFSYIFEKVTFLMGYAAAGTAFQWCWLPHLAFQVSARQCLLFPGSVPA